MVIRSICEGFAVDNAREDYKAARRVEQFRVGQGALYMAAFPGVRYLPFSAIRQAWTQDSSITVTGTCGKSLPVVVLRVRYEGDFYHTFTFEKRKNAQLALEAIAAGNPEVILEPEPVGEARRNLMAQREAAKKQE